MVIMVRGVVPAPTMAMRPFHLLYGRCKTVMRL